MCDYILLAGNVCLHLLYYRLRHQLCQWGVVPRPIKPHICLTSHQYSFHLVLEASHNIPNVWGHNPCLLPVNKYRLNHRDIKYPWCSSIFPLPYQQTQQLRPLIPLINEVMNHCLSVITRHQQDPSQVLEIWDRLKGEAVGSKCCLRSRLRFLCCHSAVFLLFHPSTEVCVWVISVEGPLRN